MQTRSIFMCAAFFSALMIASIVYTRETTNNQPQHIYSNNAAVMIPSLPNSFSFAGEPVPLDNKIIREQWEREFLYNADFLSNIRYIIKLSGRFFPAMEKVLRTNGIPEDFKYLCVAESNLQQLKSKAGAAGFWQFMPHTAALYGLEVNKYADERYHIEKSTLAACAYLKAAHKKFGSWTAAAASYNCGQQGYQTAVSFQQTNDYYKMHLPEETNRYIFRILTFKYIMENESLFYTEKENERYMPVSYKEVSVSTGVHNLTAFAAIHGLSYKELVIHNSWLRSKSLPARAGKTYKLLIPSNKQ